MRLLEGRVLYRPCSSCSYTIEDNASPTTKWRLEPGAVVQAEESAPGVTYQFWGLLNDTK